MNFNNFARHVGLKLIRFASRQSNLVTHAKREWDYAFPNDCEMQDAMKQDILDVVHLFASQGHSGFSASYALGVLEKVLSFKPLSPLTGVDDEWVEVSDGCFQNKRCGRVFKEDGNAYDIDGRVFEEPSGARFTSRESRVPVTFPYTPKTEVVKVGA